MRASRNALKPVSAWVVFECDAECGGRQLNICDGALVQRSKAFGWLDHLDVSCVWCGVCLDDDGLFRRREVSLLWFGQPLSVVLRIRSWCAVADRTVTAAPGSPPRRRR